MLRKYRLLCFHVLIKSKEKEKTEDGVDSTEPDGHTSGEATAATTTTERERTKQEEDAKGLSANAKTTLSQNGATQ